MGDSLTAATGASAKNFMDLSMENRGLSWSIGGQWNWRNVTTLPNIIKEFNPQVRSFSFHYITFQFNSKVIYYFDNSFRFIISQNLNYIFSWLDIPMVIHFPFTKMLNSIWQKLGLYQLIYHTWQKH